VCIGVEVVTAVVMKTFVLWDITPYSPSKGNLDFQRNTESIYHNTEIWNSVFPTATFTAKSLILLLYNDLILSSQVKQSVPRERLLFWEVIVPAILSKKLCKYMCLIPNGFRDKSYFTVRFQNC
jgi:hypothetical protein